jgi:hypothetical protein
LKALHAQNTLEREPAVLQVREGPTQKVNVQRGSGDTDNRGVVGTIILEDLEALVLGRRQRPGQQVEEEDDLPVARITPVEAGEHISIELPQSEDTLSVTNYELCVSLKLFVNGRGEYASSLTDTSHRLNFALDVVDA